VLYTQMPDIHLPRILNNRRSVTHYSHVTAVALHSRNSRIRGNWLMVIMAVAVVEYPLRHARPSQHHRQQSFPFTVIHIFDVFRERSIPSRAVEKEAQL
jgi:hypothetical protein